MSTEPEQRRTELLAAAFHGEWGEGPAAAFALQAAARARRHRRGRVVGMGLGTAAVAFAACLLVLRRPEAAPAARSAVSTRQPGYEIISDDELLADLHDRPLLVLPQENGGRKIVVLAEAKNG